MGLRFVDDVERDAAPLANFIMRQHATLALSVFRGDSMACALDRDASCGYDAVARRYTLLSPVSTDHSERPAWQARHPADGARRAATR